MFDHNCKKDVWVWSDTWETTQNGELSKSSENSEPCERGEHSLSCGPNETNYSK